MAKLGLAPHPPPARQATPLDQPSLLAEWRGPCCGLGRARGDRASHMARRVVPLGGRPCGLARALRESSRWQSANGRRPSPFAVGRGARPVAAVPCPEGLLNGWSTAPRRTPHLDTGG
jgi:hypothetical protein